MTIPDVWTVVRMIEWATEYFHQREVPSPRLSIEWLLAHVLDVQRLELYLIFDRPLTEDERTQLRDMVKRRAAHEPLQYICGECSFLNCTFRVDPSVLIPRQETEQLVHLFLESQSDVQTERPILLDIGTGSGCIPISIQKQHPDWTCHGIDLSERALQNARWNAERNGTATEFHLCDLMSLTRENAPFPTPVNWIISNPPYIYPDEARQMEKEVLEYEPKVALFDENPLRFYEAILHFSAATLRPEGSLWLECNPVDIDTIRSIATSSFDHIRVIEDLDQVDRFLHCSNPRPTQP
ncbi:MAG: peptide chain release factor N(5)-glutamine methyltransferase [Balneolaceae bacterium]